MKGMKSLLIFLCLISYSATPCIANEDCDCAAKPSVQWAIENADVIFEGQVTGIEVKSDRKSFLLRANRFWRGDLKNYVTVTSRFETARCDYSFQNGETYLVYANTYGLNQETLYQTSICSRTQYARYAAEDLRVLGVGRKPIGEAVRLWGALLVLALLTFLYLRIKKVRRAVI